LQAGGRRFEPGTLHQGLQGFSRLGIPALAATWLHLVASDPYAERMDVVERDIRCEHDLPRGVRIQLREIELDVLEGRISEAERDELIAELLISLGVPVARTDD
jgi:hypothetical protein